MKSTTDGELNVNDVLQDMENCRLWGKQVENEQFVLKSGGRWHHKHKKSTQLEIKTTVNKLLPLGQLRYVSQ